MTVAVGLFANGDGPGKRGERDHRKRADDNQQVKITAQPEAQLAKLVQQPRRKESVEGLHHEGSLAASASSVR